MACAHSIAAIPDPTSRRRHVYVEDYWIQHRVSIGSDGQMVSDGRIPLKMVKFCTENDWVLFERADGNQFANFATIDRSPATISPDNNLLDLTNRYVHVLHCPVSLLNNFNERVGEYAVSCNQKLGCMIQSQSSHHIGYEGFGLVRGSSGGAVQLVESNELFAMHCELINDADFDEDVDERRFAHTSKETSEDDPPVAAPPAKKPKVCLSETVCSLTGGCQGQGRAIIVSKFKKLMQYLDQIEA